MKLIISSADGKSKVVELDVAKIRPLIGKKIGDIIDGSLVGLEGYRLRITGGTDYSGFPMRSDIHGGAKKGIVLSGGVGFHPKKKGERKRRYVRGNTVTDEIVQLNLVIAEETKKQ
jgi:small subunit ribosomal protein S6e